MKTFYIDGNEFNIIDAWKDNVDLYRLESYQLEKDGKWKEMWIGFGFASKSLYIGLFKYKKIREKGFEQLSSTIGVHIGVVRKKEKMVDIVGINLSKNFGMFSCKWILEK